MFIFVHLTSLPSRKPQNRNGVLKLVHPDVNLRIVDSLIDENSFRLLNGRCVLSSCTIYVYSEAIVL
jgi:hypothetical protein